MNLLPRMVHLVFKGLRFGFLTEQLPLYTAAAADGTVKEFLDTLYARYARRFPIDVPLDVDPLPDALAAVDDDAPEPEQDFLADLLSPEEQGDAERKMVERQALIQKRKKVCVLFISKVYVI